MYDSINTIYDENNEILFSDQLLSISIELNKFVYVEFYYGYYYSYGNPLTNNP